MSDKMPIVKGHECWCKRETYQPHIYDPENCDEDCDEPVEDDNFKENSDE